MISKEEIKTYLFWNIITSVAYDTFENFKHQFLIIGDYGGVGSKRKVEQILEILMPGNVIRSPYPDSKFNCFALCLNLKFVD